MWKPSRAVRSLSRAAPCRSPDLLIALNAELGDARAAICRLGQTADLWADRLRDVVPDALAREVGVPRGQLERARALLQRAERLACRERQTAAALGGRILTSVEPDYPEALHDLALPPPVLYCCGEIPVQPAVAVVGSRYPDAYGQQVARNLGRALAERGMSIVSGFARGIDAAAHRGALDAVGGTTVAVLGCGLGVDYPRGHGRLFQQIADRGAVITELPCHRPPRPWHFPVRNRIIAALALGTLVVQGALRSGSLITARFSLELGRDVYAVPGRIFDERALGPNSLIRDGALLVQHPEDIIDSLAMAVQQQLSATPPPEASASIGLPGIQAAVLAEVPRGELRTADEIATSLEAPVDQVLGVLLELELAGWIQRRPGPTYSRGR